MNKAFLWYGLTCFIITSNHKGELDWSIRNHSWTDDTSSIRPDIRLHRILKYTFLLFFYLQNSRDYAPLITSTSLFHGKSPRKKESFFAIYGNRSSTIVQFARGNKINTINIFAMPGKGSEMRLKILNRPNCPAGCYQNHLNRGMTTSLLLVKLVSREKQWSNSYEYTQHIFIS